MVSGRRPPPHRPQLACLALLTAVFVGPRVGDARLAPAVAADSIPVVLPDTAVPSGSRIDLPLRVDMTGAGSLGSFQGAIRFTPGVVTYVGVAAGTYVGSVELNTDSATAGVVRFAGANSDSTVNRGALTLVVLTVDVGGSGGEVVKVTPEITELALAGRFEVVTDSATVEGGSVTVDPGPVGMQLRPDPAGAKNGVPTYVDLRLDLTSSSAAPGAFEGKLTVDPTFGSVDSAWAGDFGESLTTNLAMHADSGFVRWAVLGEDPLPSDTMLVARFFLTPLVEAGASNDVAVIVTEALNAPNLASLLPFLEGPAPLTLYVVGGLWGDASRSWQNEPTTIPISAFDALVCLIGVVGGDVSAFDPGACDVAPDVGASYDGTINSMDALVILTYVVGLDTSAYRVGQPR